MTWLGFAGGMIPFECWILIEKLDLHQLYYPSSDGEGSIETISLLYSNNSNISGYLGVAYVVSVVLGHGPYCCIVLITSGTIMEDRFTSIHSIFSLAGKG